MRSWSPATIKKSVAQGRKAAPAGGPIGTKSGGSITPKSGGPIQTKSGGSNHSKSCNQSGNPTARRTLGGRRPVGRRAGDRRPPGRRRKTEPATGAIQRTGPRTRRADHRAAGTPSVVHQRGTSQQGLSAAVQPLRRRDAVRDARGGSVRTIPLTGEKLRTDLSATLFLSPPDAYEGGELVIERHRD